MGAYQQPAMNDDMYKNSGSKPSGGTSVAQGTGEGVDLKAPAPKPQGPSLGEVVARLKAEKAAKAASKDGKAPTKVVGSYKKGGKVKKTAIYKLHKGERVLNPKQTKKAEKSSAMKTVLSGK